MLRDHSLLQFVTTAQLDGQASAVRQPSISFAQYIIAMSARSPLLSARAASPRQSQQTGRSHLSRNDKYKVGLVIAAATLLLSLLIVLMIYVGLPLPTPSVQRGLFNLG